MSFFKRILLLSKDNLYVREFIHLIVESLILSYGERFLTIILLDDFLLLFVVFLLETFLFLDSAAETWLTSDLLNDLAGEVFIKSKTKDIEIRHIAACFEMFKIIFFIVFFPPCFLYVISEFFLHLLLRL